MTKAQIAQTTPCEVALEAGKKYAWCSCGLSSKQPLCDGSHSGGAFKPYVFTAEETKTVWLCGCKQSKNTPFCDGSHSEL